MNVKLRPRLRRHDWSEFSSDFVQICACIQKTYLSLAGNEEMEKSMEITRLGYIETTIGIHSFIPS